MIAELLSRWPLIKQIKTGSDGTGPKAMTERTRHLLPRTSGAQVARSVCPYCGVGCGQLVYHKDGKLISIEGDPDSPISSGRLCPNSDTYELHTPGRLKKLKYRRPYSQRWEDLDLETAMGMVATRVWESRERTFVEKENGALVSGDSTNDLLPISEEPNVRIMEAKALMCDITPGKRPRGKEALDFFATKMRAA